jgi:hypothetical protein
MNLGGQFVLLWIPALPEQNLEPSNQQTERSLSAEPSNMSRVQTSVGDASFSTVLQSPPQEAVCNQLPAVEHQTQHLQRPFVLQSLQSEQQPFRSMFHPHTTEVSKFQSELSPNNEVPVGNPMPHNKNHVEHEQQEQIIFKQRFLQHSCHEFTKIQPQRLQLAEFLCKSEQPIQEKTTNKATTSRTTNQQLQNQPLNLKATTHTAIPSNLPYVNTSILAREHSSNQQPSIHFQGSAVHNKFASVYQHHGIVTAANTMTTEAEGCNNKQNQNQQRITGNSKLVINALISNSTKSSEEDHSPLGSGISGCQELGKHHQVTKCLQPTHRDSVAKFQHQHQHATPTTRNLEIQTNQLAAAPAKPTTGTGNRHRQRHNKPTTGTGNSIRSQATDHVPVESSERPMRMLPLQHLHRGNSQALGTNSRIDDNFEDDNDFFCATPEPSPRMWSFAVPQLPCCNFEVDCANEPVEVESSPFISSPIRSIPEGCTTLVIRNIPARYNQDMLLHAFREDVGYNLLILPFCTRSNRTMGYAFINFLNDTLASRFQSRWHHNFLPNHGRTKHLDVTIAAVQGLRANLRQFNTRSVSRLRRSDMLPAFFNEQGQRLDALSELRRHGVIKSRSR